MFQIKSYIKKEKEKKKDVISYKILNDFVTSTMLNTRVFLKPQPNLTTFSQHVTCLDTISQIKCIVKMF